MTASVRTTGQLPLAVWSGSSSSSVAERVPAPPADDALPELARFLDPSEMAERLFGALEDCRGGRLAIIGCRPFYVRYKQRTSCLVGWELAFQDAEVGSVRSQLAQGVLLDTNGAAAAWPSARLHRLVEKARRLHPGRPLDRAVFVQSLPAVLTLLPVDRALPALVTATSPVRMRRLLRHLDRTETRIEACAVDLVRYRPARKALLRYQLGGPDPKELFGKIHADGAWEERLRVEVEAARAGVPLAAPVGAVPYLGMIVTDRRAGRRLADLRGDPAHARPLPAVAAALSRLHMGAVAVVPPSAGSTEADLVRAAGDAVGVLLPALAADATRLAEAIAARIEARPHRPAPIHGDFYDDQVLVSEDGVTLLDFDEARLDDPLVDIGTFLAHLTLGEESVASAESRSADAERQAFLEAYAATPAGSGQRKVAKGAALYESGRLLQLATEPFRQLQADWPEQIERRLALARLRYEESRSRGTGVRRSVPTAAAQGTATIDPALPHLGEAADGDRMARVFSRRVYGVPVQVRGIAVVRHRPGRRATLRYQLRVGAGRGRAEVLYGKLFASDRGPTVHATLGALNRATGRDSTAPRLPQAVGYVEELGLVLYHGVTGRPILSELLVGRTTLAERVAGALHALHATQVVLPKRHGLDSELGILRERVERLARTDPELADPSAGILARLSSAAAATRTWRWRPVHRDFYPEQVLVDGGRIVFLDLDDAAMSEPAVDVANFVAHLSLMRLTDDAADALVAIADAFVATYHRLDPQLDLRLVRLLQAGTLLRLAQIHAPRRGRTVAADLVRQAETVLKEAA